MIWTGRRAGALDADNVDENETQRKLILDEARRRRACREGPRPERRGPSLLLRTRTARSAVADRREGTGYDAESKVRILNRAPFDALARAAESSFLVMM